METNKQTILLEQTVEYVNEQFHLDTKYSVTQFRHMEKAIAITVDNGTHELAIKIKGKAKHDLEKQTLAVLEDLGLVEEDAEEVELEEMDEDYDGIENY